ncbi:MAG: ABC transporter ATP-binding protein [Bacteroidetes bacterium]|nr:ABC transporter ATP-binding protein [Bacteroidota bacterium]MBL6943195.1 ABC transporter ATP-binding protein [Bacteroidales bacterium]
MSVHININKICKSYDDVEALKDITLSINAGEIFGFIGPDGAGKTSLFRILTSLLIPTSGTATVGDYDVVKDYKKIRQSTGYMPGRFSLYLDLTVEENLNFYASIFNTSLKENYDLIKDIYIQIEPFKKRRAGDLSGGMKQKLALSCALIHSPKLIILDEPTTGVDAVSRMEFWELLKKMQKRGITIIVSTPYMDEAALCDHVALIQGGKLLAVDKPENIVKSFKGSLFAVSANNMHKLIYDLDNLMNTSNVFRFGETIHITSNIDDDLLYTENAHKHLSESGYHNITINRVEPVIEDCFLALMDQDMVKG